MGIAPRIMVVEDEFIVAIDIKNELMRMGFPPPLIAFTKNEAIQLANESRPDIVLMDIGLADDTFGGITAAKTITEEFDIPVIYVTANENEETVSRVKDTEMYGYILKPIHYRELRLAIELALHRHKAAKQIREQKKWLTTIIDSIGDGIIATDEQERIIFMNPAAEKLSGYVQSEANGSLYSEIVHTITRDIPGSGPELVWGIGKSRIEKKRTMLVSRDGNEREITTTTWVLRQDDGEKMGKVFVIKAMNEDIQSGWSASPEIL